MHNQILKQLSLFISLDKSEEMFFLSKLIFKAYKKKELILQEGEVCKYAYFINSGCLRYYYTVDGQENTA